MDDKTSLLRDEYLLVLKFYEDFDARLITIKGWSGTIALAALGLGFQNTKPELWLFASGASLVFWILEGTWKTFQYAYRDRIKTIETAFRENDIESVYPFQTYQSWYTGRKKISFLKVMLTPYVMFPHIVTALAGIGMFYCFR